VTRENSEQPSVRTLTVAVLTYKRPKDIAAILPLLVEQCSTVASESLVPSVLVIDNDPASSARAFVDGFGSQSPAIPVRYQVETTPGISAARNRALSESADADLLVFIDDDERPSPAWLANLLSVFDRFECAAVVGPVVSEYEIEPDEWIVAGGFFVRRRLPTGTQLEVAATNNLLLDLRKVRSHSLRFDLDFGITGGDDTMFTRELRQAGEVMIWCDEAIVVDVVPADRVTRRWVVLRAMSSGNSWSLTSVKLARTRARRTATRGVLTAKGLVRVAGGAVRLGAGAVTRSLRHRARGTRTLARGAGMVTGAWGYSYEEYRRS
jgi:succinoglycan biosynthesis protein ExoM